MRRASSRLLLTSLTVELLRVTIETQKLELQSRQEALDDVQRELELRELCRRKEAD